MSVEVETILLAADGIAALVRRRQGAELWRADGGSRSWEDFGRLVETARGQCVLAGAAPGEIIVVPGEASLESVAWLLGAAAAGLVAAPLRRDRLGEMEAWMQFLRLDWQARDGRVDAVAAGRGSPVATNLLAGLRARGAPGLILATGGTTGTPKVLLHDLRALLATIPVKHGRARTVLPLMRFDHIGGLDMAWRALAGGQIMVAPPEDLAPETIAATIAKHRVEVMPATPSLLNLLLLAEAPRKFDLSSLRVVPYGAEAMPAGLLARLRASLPRVDFVQRFGTSETGALPVHQSGAGLALDPLAEGFAWKIRDGELWVKSPACALGYLTGDAARLAAPGWFQTGDLAEEMPDGGIRLVGRRDEVINVGGEKVLPAVVESALLLHPQVADCRVLAVPNALLGQMVAAEVVWSGREGDPVAVKQLLVEFARGKLPRSHLPAMVRLVPAIATTRNFKKKRTGS